MWKHETDCVIPLSKTEVLTWPSNGPKIFVSLFQTHRSVSQYLKDLPLHQLFRVANYVLSKVFKGCFYLDVDSKRPSLQISLRKSHPHLLIGLCVLYRRRQWHPHSSTLAWKIPWAEEPGRLQSVGSRRVRHDWATSLSLFTLECNQKISPTYLWMICTLHLLNFLKAWPFIFGDKWDSIEKSMHF